MYHGIFDSHAHYNDARFDEDRNQLLSSLPEKGVCGLINCGTDVTTSYESRTLAEQFSFVYFAAGIHPEDCRDVPIKALDEIEALVQHEKCVAVGEIGLDYYWPEPPKDVQLRFFEAQLQLALRHDMPVIIHDRDAHGPTMEMLRKYRPKGVLHCFSGSIETMKEAINLELYIGLGGAVTFKNAKKAIEVAKEVPADKLLLETDCPYMTPTPFRGKRNDSSLIAYTAEFIAGLRNINTQDLIDKCTENTKSLFFNA